MGPSGRYPIAIITKNNLTLTHQNQILKTFLSIIISFIFSYSAFTQNTVTGTIKDKNTGEPISYAAVFVFQKASGTVTNENGVFEMTITKFSKSDSVEIYLIGYNSLFLTINDLIKNNNGTFYLEETAYEVQEVTIKPRKHKMLGTSKYSKTNCSAFAGEDPNWRGKQVAIRANNEAGLKVYLESFQFYIVKNEYIDSLTFRIMLYEVNEKEMPGKTFLKQPIVFKTNIKQGEVSVDLKEYNISTTGDFFISLECLEETMESSKFCFAGSIRVASYFKTSAFSRWGKVKGGGADLNIKVSYQK